MSLADLTRPAGDDDVVGGVPARLVAAPASTAEASALVRAAAGLTVAVRGAGTKIDWGTPPRTLDLIIDTHRLAGVREHAAGDLITVVGAGTRLGDLDLPGQQLALDSSVPGATVGGTVAAGVSGPRRMLYGTARDLLIGIEVVRADGTVARSGGKVVKNVAGYDLGKLFTGAYGTLGLITECAFRLHPLPPAAAHVTATASSPAEAGRLVAAVLAAQVVPSAIEVNAPPTGDIELAVLVEGTPAGVRDRAEALATILAPTLPPSFALSTPAHRPPAPDTPAHHSPALSTPAHRPPAPDTPAHHSLALSTPAHRPPTAATPTHHPPALSTPAHPSAPAWWNTLPWAAGGVGLKLTARLSRVPDLLAAARAAEVPVTVRGSAGTGVLYAAAGDAPMCSEQRGVEAIARSVARLRAAAVEAGGHAVVLTAPAGIRAAVDMWGPVPGLELMRRVKDQFDPAGMFAPGRFVGGI